MADIGTVKLLFCYALKGDKLTIRKWNGFGQRKAYKFPRGTRNDGDFIIKIVQSSGFVLLIQTTFGLSTSCMINSAMAAVIKCSQS